MRLFRCQICSQTVFFENVECDRCGNRLGYLPEIGLMSAMQQEPARKLVEVLQAAGLLDRPTPSAVPRLAVLRPGQRYRFCANAEPIGCNWVIPEDAKHSLCASCRTTRAVSNPGVEQNRERWARLEAAKRRLIYSLVKLGLPTPSRDEDPAGLAFEFLADPDDPGLPRIMTGHAKGLITIALREADDVQREAMRTSLGEPYRTLLGHFRHEIGHYLWLRLVEGSDVLPRFRALFGDERADYGGAIHAYYASGAPPGWQQRFISAYATMHPWEDFAETWAHYLHMVDTLETASAHGVELHMRDDAVVRCTEPGFDPYHADAFAPLVEKWRPLALTANSLNRSMGLPDLYPFVLTEPVVAKLAFVHDLVHQHRARAYSGAEISRVAG